MSLQFGIPLFLIAALLQATVAPHLRVLGGQPDLIVVITLIWAALDRGLEGMSWAFVGGLFLDLISGAPLGTSSLALVPIAYLVSLTEAQVYQSSLLPLIVCSGGAIAYHVGYLIIMRFMADLSLPWSEALWYVTLPSVLFDIVLMIPTLFLLGRLYRRLHPVQAKI